MEKVTGANIGIPGDPEEAFGGECEGGGIVKFVDDEMDDIVWAVLRRWVMERVTGKRTT